MKFEFKPFQFVLNIIIFKDKVRVNFNFERAPLKLQRSIKSKMKKTMKRKKEEGKKMEELYAACGKKTEITGAV